MPVKKCQSDGKPGYKYGDSGKCYTYDTNDEESKKKALEQAKKQGRAIEIQKHLGMGEMGIEE